MCISGLTTLSDLLRHLRESIYFYLIYFYLIRGSNKRFVTTLIHKHSFLAVVFNPSHPVLQYLAFSVHITCKSW